VVLFQRVTMIESKGKQHKPKNYRLTQKKDVIIFAPVRKSLFHNVDVKQINGKKNIGMAK